MEGREPMDAWRRCRRVEMTKESEERDGGK